MTLKLDIVQIEMFMKSLYTLTGIRFVLFDTSFREIIAYPREGCDFCKLMKSCPKTRRRCDYADRKSFQKCSEINSLVLYKCHAGLVEATFPLHANDKIIGYLMFGQLSDNPDKPFLFENIDNLSAHYGFLKSDLEQSIKNIAFKSKEEIDAAANIMEACTSYIIYKELITPEDNRIIEAAKLYIEEHLYETINITALCQELDVGRTRLYELFRTEVKKGIAEYIRYRRMHRAKKLLKTTDLAISEIAHQVGFPDYNYFSRVYKKSYGKSPKHYRK